MFEGVAVGDPHLDKLNKFFGPNVGNDLIISEMEVAFDYALNNAIPHVFLMGDVADKPRLSDDGYLKLIKFLHKYDGKLNIYIILGNHDWAEKDSYSLRLLELLCRLGMFKTVHVYSTVTSLDISGVRVNFLPYPVSKAPDYDKPSINFGHFERAGALRDNGQRIKPEDGVEDVVDTDNYYIVGHLHTPHDVANCHYVGTLYQTSFGEKPEKSFTHFRVSIEDGKLVTKTRRITHNPKVKLTNLVVEDQQDLQQVEQDEYHLYKLLTQADVILPDSLLTDNPNIVNVVGYKDKKELKAIVFDELFIESEDDREEFGLEEQITGYLEKQFNATQDQIKRANEIVKNLVENALKA